MYIISKNIQSYLLHFLFVKKNSDMIIFTFCKKNSIDLFFFNFIYKLVVLFIYYFNFDCSTDFIIFCSTKDITHFYRKKIIIFIITIT